MTKLSESKLPQKYAPALPFSWQQADTSTKHTMASGPVSGGPRIHSGQVDKSEERDSGRHGLADNSYVICAPVPWLIAPSHFIWYFAVMKTWREYLQTIIIKRFFLVQQ